MGMGGVSRRLAKGLVTAFGSPATCGRISLPGLSAPRFPVRCLVFVSINVWGKFLLGAEFVGEVLSRVPVVRVVSSDRG